MITKSELGIVTYQHKKLKRILSFSFQVYDIYKTVIILWRTEAKTQNLQDDI